MTSEAELLAALERIATVDMGGGFLGALACRKVASEAIAAWNTRATPPAQGEAVAWLRDAHEGEGDECLVPAAQGDPGSFPVYTAPPPVTGEGVREALSDGLMWAIGRWKAEVEHRPIQNKNRRPLDDAWRQVIRKFGGGPETLLPLPDHDAILAALTHPAGGEG